MKGFLTPLKALIRYLVKGFVKIFSAFNDTAEPSAPWSLRRLLAAFFAWLFYLALREMFPLLASTTPPSTTLVCITLGAPLLGVIIMLFFSTWSDVTAIIRAAKGEK